MVRLWEAPNGRPLATLLGHTSGVRDVALSADGHLLASGALDGTVRLWAVPDGLPLAILQGHTGAVYGLALAADGQVLASGSEDGTIRLWEVCSGKCLRTLRSDRRYERLDITGLTGVTTAQRVALLTRELSITNRILSSHQPKTDSSDLFIQQAGTRKPLGCEAAYCPSNSARVVTPMAL